MRVETSESAGEQVAEEELKRLSLRVEGTEDLVVGVFEREVERGRREVAHHVRPVSFTTHHTHHIT